MTSVLQNTTEGSTESSNGRKEVESMNVPIQCLLQVRFFCEIEQISIRGKQYYAHEMIALQQGDASGRKLYQVDLVH